MTGSGAVGKGKDYERELVNQAREEGLEAERAWGSDGRAFGRSKETDILVEGVSVQAKRFKEGMPKWIQEVFNTDVDAMAMRENRGETVVLLRWPIFLLLLKKAKETNG